MRVTSYGVGIALTLVSAPLLLRHLGVDRYGLFVTATALVTVAALVADAGLTVLGVREFSTRSLASREGLMRNLLYLRLLLALVTACGAILFATVAGYPSAMTDGVALAGAGMVLATLQQTLTIPLAAQLRQSAIAALELVTRAATVAATLALIAAGAALLPFLAIPIPVSLAALAATAVVVRNQLPARRRPDGREIRRLLRSALPIAAASVLGAVFYRVAVIVLSVTAPGNETGYFAASGRIIEALLPIPSIVASAVFPVLVQAADEGEDSLAGPFGRLLEAALVLGGALAVVLIAGSEAFIAFLGGREFASSAAVLQIQGPAIIASFAFAALAAGLWALHQQRALLIATLAGLGSIITLTVILGGYAGARGAAIAMLVSEAVLVLTAGYLLLRRRPVLRPRAVFLVKLGSALAAGVAIGLAGFPSGVAVVLATAVYGGIVLGSRAMSIPPAELIAALRPARRSGGDG